MNIKSELKEIIGLHIKSESLREEAWAKEDSIKRLAIHALEVLYPEQSFKFAGERPLITKQGIKFTKKVQYGVGFGIYEDKDKLNFYEESYTLSYDDLQLYIDETS